MDSDDEMGWSDPLVQWNHTKTDTTLTSQQLASSSIWLYIYTLWIKETRIRTREENSYGGIDKYF